MVVFDVQPAYLTTEAKQTRSRTKIGQMECGRCDCRRRWFAERCYVSVVVYQSETTKPSRPHSFRIS